MSSEPALSPIVASLPSSVPPRRSFGQRRAKSASSLSAQGEPMVWLTGGCLAVSLAMICGLLCLVVSQGLSTFWPVPVVRIETRDGHAYLGEVTRHDEFRPESTAALPAHHGAQLPAEASLTAPVHRELLRTGNFELTGTHFHWIDDEQIALEMEPEWALVVERLNWGRFYGTPEAFLIDGQVKADKPAEIWARYLEFHGPALATLAGTGKAGALCRRRNQSPP